MTLNEYLSRGRDTRHITADSRSVFDPAETVFAAIRTSVADGHKYIGELYQRGVRSFIVEELPHDIPADAEFIVTDNVPLALCRIAKERLSCCSNGIIITGSIGKTTMKELLYTALRPFEDVRRSPRSWNSSIGVPLSVCDMTRTDSNARHFITEAGIDAPGQAELLHSTLADSHSIAIITPITTEHDEAFASHREKVAEKMRVIAGADTIIYADSDSELSDQIKELQKHKAGVAAYAVRQGYFPSIYHALADKVMDVIGYGDEQRRTIRDINLVDKRRVIAAGSYGNTIYLDRFTPDIRSLQESLDFMRRHATPSREKVLIVGELLDCDSEHVLAICSSLAQKFGVDRVEKSCPELLARIHTGGDLRDAQILLFGQPSELMTKIAEALETAGHHTIL
ncbi:MAG: hypothetical protein K2L75_01265, partial [Muribaculaceae bacterium]|nr:hypothetical protein [Muribaculaceae bacterium]